MKSRKLILGTLILLLVLPVGCQTENTTQQGTTLPTGEVEVLPYTKTLEEPIRLLNNLGADNSTWSELKAFLKSDNTEEKVRSEGFFTSFAYGDYAEMLHNNAEKSGIRAAVVALHFTDGNFRIIDAFYTTDMGLVYIDDTGLSLDDRMASSDWMRSEDRVAYVVEGQKFGLISLDVVTSPSYDFYVDYETKIAEYDKRVESYNADVNAYNSALGGREYLEEPEYTKFKHWYDRLEEEGRELDRLRLSLSTSGYYWLPLGTVSDIEIFW